jgi:hypothetical protein
MKTKPFFFLIAFLLPFFFSCSDSLNFEGGKESETEMNSMPYSADKDLITITDETSSIPPPPPPYGVKNNITEGSGVDETITIEKQIIKTADIRFGVSDYKKSKTAIDTIVSKHKGYIASENESNSDYSISNTIVIRVPAENFSKLMADLEGEAEQFESKNINTSDVTEEYIDILKRLDNKKKVEAQYIELLKKAHTISEILQVNEQIRVLREEIEAKEGRLNYLKSQVGFSTITLYMHQDYSTVSYGFFQKIGEALNAGWQGILAFVIGLLYLWPLWIIVAVVIVFVRRGIKKRRAKKLSETMTS